jgi:hypothetical protein
MNELDIKTIEQSRGKCPIRYRLVAWFLAIATLATIVFLFLYLPVLVEILLVIALMVAAIAMWKAEGFRAGRKFFIKEILFGL